MKTLKLFISGLLSSMLLLGALMGEDEIGVNGVQENETKLNIQPSNSNVANATQTKAVQKKEGKNINSAYALNYERHRFGIGAGALTSKVMIVRPQSMYVRELYIYDAYGYTRYVEIAHIQKRNGKFENSTSTPLYASYQYRKPLGMNKDLLPKGFFTLDFIGGFSNISKEAYVLFGAQAKLKRIGLGFKIGPSGTIFNDTYKYQTYGATLGLEAEILLGQAKGLAFGVLGSAHEVKFVGDSIIVYGDKNYKATSLSTYVMIRF